LARALLERSMKASAKEVSKEWQLKHSTKWA